MTMSKKIVIRRKVGKSPPKTPKKSIPPKIPIKLDNRGKVIEIYKEWELLHTTTAKKMDMTEESQEPDVIIPKSSIMEIKVRDFTSTVNSNKFSDQLSRYEDYAAKNDIPHIYFIARIMTNEDILLGFVKKFDDVTTTHDLAVFNSKMRAFPNIRSYLKFSDEAVIAQIVSLARKPESVQLDIHPEVMETGPNERPYVKAMATLIPGVPIKLAIEICNYWDCYATIQGLQNVIDKHYWEKSHEEIDKRVWRHYKAKAEKVYNIISGTFCKGF